MASNLELLQIPPLYLSPEEVKDNRSSDQIVPRKIPDITSVLNRVSFTPAWTQPLMVTPLIRNSGSYLLPWNSSAPETAQCCPNYSIISAHQLICYRYALMSPDHLKRKVSSDIDPVILRAGILNSSSIRTTASNSAILTVRDPARLLRYLWNSYSSAVSLDDDGRENPAWRVGYSLATAALASDWWSQTEQCSLGLTFSPCFHNYS